jgi:hypothetical protein
MRNSIETASHGMIYILSFGHSGYYLDKLRGCSVGNTNKRDFIVIPVRWSQVARYAYQVS